MICKMYMRKTNVGGRTEQNLPGPSIPEPWSQLPEGTPQNPEQSLWRRRFFLQFLGHSGSCCCWLLLLPQVVGQAAHCQTHSNLGPSLEQKAEALIFFHADSYSVRGKSKATKREQN